MSAKGAIACGHPATAAAAREILEDGGNAFDAALAALCAACVAEPVLCSLGGGGYLLARRADGEAVLYDFFVETPFERRDAAEIDFYPILADFGTATQEFHIGLGAIATPGAAAGATRIERDRAASPPKSSRTIIPSPLPSRPGRRCASGTRATPSRAAPPARCGRDPAALLYQCSVGGKVSHGRR